VVLAMTPLVLAAALLAALEPPRPADDLGFARATGGVGLGPAAAADWSFFAFDPRIESHCEAETWPIPGGHCYVPHHGAALWSLRPFDRR
jgi:hypothetical protein